MIARRRVLLAPAASAQIGGGHVLRALALAVALEARGATCALAVGPYGASLATRFGEGVEVLPLRDGGSHGALAAAVAAFAADVLVLDDYAADARTVHALGPVRPKVAVIDDLADRAHDCELLVDPGHGRSADDYAGLVPAPARVLTGPAYALLRPGFARGGSRPEAPPKIGRVFVSLGLGDAGAVTLRVVERLLALSPEVDILAALAAEAPSLAPLEALARRRDRLSLHIDARAVAGLMAGCDAAVGAGGASTWERCALGLPSLAVVVADNQRRVTRALAADGVLLACDLAAPTFESDFDTGWRELQDRAGRTELAARSLALCDGGGAARVAEAIVRL